MDVTFVVDRLKAQLVGAGLKSIGSSADLDSAMEGAVATPSLFLMPLTESAERSAMINQSTQRITQGFGVITVAANRRDALGKATLDDLVPIRAAIKAALIGWVPFPETGEAVQFTEGRLLKFEQGRIWWTDQFAVRTYAGA